MWTKYFIAVIAIIFLLPVQLCQFQLCVSTLCELCQDGLVPRAIASNSDENKVPLWGSVMCGIISAVCAMILNLTCLSQLLSISFILVHTIAALVVLALRFRPTEESANEAQKRREIHKRQRKRGRPGKSLRNNNVSGQDRNHYGSTVPPSTIQSSDVGVSAEPNDGSRQPQASSNPSTNGTIGTTADSIDDVELLGRTESLSNQVSGDQQDNASSSDSDIDDVVEEYKYSVCIRVLSEQRHRDFFLRTPTVATYRRALLALLGFLVFSLCVAAILLRGQAHLATGSPAILVFLVVFLILVIACLAVAVRQPIDTVECVFLLIKVPCVPWLPLLAVFINVHLVVAIGAIPWVQLAVWSLIGMK